MFLPQGFSYLVFIKLHARTTIGTTVVVGRTHSIVDFIFVTFRGSKDSIPKTLIQIGVGFVVVVVDVVVIIGAGVVVIVVVINDAA